MKYLLSNGSRQTRFEGEQLVHATSRGHTVPADALRWTDVDIYRTKAGKYVLHKVGRSRVYCRPEDASDTSVRKNGPKLLVDEKGQDLAPCPVCKPGPLATAGWVYVESDRGSVVVCDTAEGLVESCYQKDADGVLFVTRTARWALDELAKLDPAVHEAWMIEVVA